VFWVNVGEIDFAEGNPVRKLTISTGTIFSSNTAEKFEKAEPFTFLPADGK
jgi:choloylglycine hydrolase